jgi:hypothetical protein
MVELHSPFESNGKHVSFDEAKYGVVLVPLLGSTLSGEEINKQGLGWANIRTAVWITQHGWARLLLQFGSGVITEEDKPSFDEIYSKLQL